MLELRAAQCNEGKEIYDMLVEIGPGENGFVNPGFKLYYADFNNFLQERIEMAEGSNLPAGYVPQTTYWLLDHSRPIGVGKLRHYLNDSLRQSGGHIGYTIRPSERGKGYGVKMLGELIKAAKHMGIQELLLTCDESNWPSRRVIESNSGRLQQSWNGKCKYFITP